MKNGIWSIQVGFASFRGKDTDHKRILKVLSKGSETIHVLVLRQSNATTVPFLQHGMDIFYCGGPLFQESFVKAFQIFGVIHTHCQARFFGENHVGAVELSGFHNFHLLAFRAEAHFDTCFVIGSKSKKGHGRFR